MVQNVLIHNTNFNCSLYAVGRRSSSGGGLSVSIPSKKTRCKKKLRISSDGQNADGAAPKLTPQQISLIAGILTGCFAIQSVIYSRDNVLQVILTTNRLTDLPILGPTTSVDDQDLQDAINIEAINLLMNRS